MKNIFGLSVIVAIALSSTAVVAATADGAGTHRRSLVESSNALDMKIAKTHVHPMQKAAVMASYHEGVDSTAPDKAREIRRLDEKNNRGRALR